MNKRPVVGYLALLLAAALAAPADAQQGAPEDGQWPTYGGDLGNTKYSPLDQIDAENFSQLRIAWRALSPDAFLSLSMPDGSEWRASSEAIIDALTETDPERYRPGAPPSVFNFQVTPLMVDGVLYISTPLSQAAALDARTGETIWVYNPRSYEEGTPAVGITWRHRGLAYWRDGRDERVYWGTGNGYLMCVQARTGRPCADFGEGGRLDLMGDVPKAERGERDWRNALLYSLTSPPIIVGDTIIPPNAITSQTLTLEAPMGRMRGFDVRTGELKWIFNTIPEPGEFGHETWENDAWRYTGKIGVWTIMSADPELGLVYLPLNTPAPDYYGGHRPGDNLFAESLVALNAETGERVWHFQIVRHGLWDYDLPAAPTLMDVVVDGRPVKAVAQITKQGFVFAFDRATGEPLWPIEDRPVPTDTDIEGEKPSPTQPFPTKPAPFEYQGTSIDDLVDFTPEIRQMAIDAVKDFRLGPLYTPHSRQGTIMRPGTPGGGNWSGAAFDPETGILYIPSRSSHSIIRLRDGDPERGETLRYVEDSPGVVRMPQGLPLWKPPYSRMTAIDMNTGEHVWMTPLGNGDRVRNHPMLRDLNLPPVGGDSGIYGPLLTKTLLIYALTAGGTNDGPRLVAYDKATGAELGSVDLPGNAIGTPMTYMLDGRQHIALTVRTADRPAPELVVYALPDN